MELAAQEPVFALEKKDFIEPASGAGPVPEGGEMGFRGGVIAQGQEAASAA